MSKTLSILKELLSWNFDCAPCYNTIENWIKKSGYSIYKEPVKEATSGNYAAIFDESMMVGSQKMLLTLGVKADKKGNEPLCHSDVAVLKMSVKSSWNKQSVAADLEELAGRIGHPPDYVVSDNGGSLTHALQKLKIIHVRDVSHTLGLLMEHAYKDEEEFTAYMKAVSLVKFQSVMKSTAYLLAPKQRTIARFLNLSQIAEWSAKMLSVYTRLLPQEQQTFAFIPQYASFIEELQDTLTCINAIQKEVKAKGLSRKTYQTSMAHIKKSLSPGNERMIRLAQSIVDYLNVEISKMPDEKISWNASSDIIESLFGVYKDRKSPNPLHGMTTFSLFLPLYTRIGSEKGVASFDFKACLERTFLSEIDEWKKTNLIENQVSKRIKILQSA